MANFGIGFNSRGQFTTFPTIFSNINIDDLDMRNQGPTGVVAIVGPGAGFFPPKKPSALPLATPPNRFLAPSDLLTAAQYAVRPFPELDRGLNQVFVVPVTAATQASGTEASVTPTNLFTVTAKVWGLKGNEITRKMETNKFTIALVTASGTVTEVFPFTTIAGLVADINARAGLVGATFLAEGTPVNHAATALTGATEPAVTNQDWTDALASLTNLRVHVIHVVSSSSAIWAMLSAHCTLRRCRGIIGGGLRNWNGISNRQTAIAALKAEAAALNAFRLMHVGVGADGLASYLTAARYAALAGTLEPSVPMTFKHLDFESLETLLDIDTEVGGIDGLLLGGIAPPVQDPSAPGTYLVSRGLSTFITDANLYHREHSVLAAVDAVQFLIEDQLRQILGREGTVNALRRVNAIVDQVLNQCTRPTSAVRIASYRRDSIRSEFTSDTVLRVYASLTPIPPINFIDVNLGLERLELSVTFDVPLAA